MAATGRDVGKFLSEKQSTADSELAREWGELETSYNKRLWHQATLKLEQFVKHPALQSGNSLVELYHNFIAEFESKINPLSLVEICAVILQQINDSEEALQFLDKLEGKVKVNSEAVVLCKVLKGQITLHKLSKLSETKELIDDAEKLLESVDGITTVHGRYYLLASDLYRIQGKHADYYRAALRYLGCMELTELNDEQQQQHAFFLGLAALLGEGIYNFGELLAHPVLQSLKDTEKQWLIDLLFSFNAGRITEFERLRPNWSQIPDLQASELALRQKISLLCLMEMTFKRPATNRMLTFDEIATETMLPLNEVEILVMKALALGLVKGSIDQVDCKVHLTWVQPRVLDKEQIATMMLRLDHWCKDVTSMEMLLENKASDILTL